MPKIMQTIILYALIIVGLAYAFIPHATHVSFGIDLGLEHSMHQIIGYASLVGAALYYFFVVR